MTLNHIFIDLKFSLLADVSLINWLACTWLTVRREGL